MISRIRQAVAWFIDGLIEACAAVEDGLRRRGHLCIVRAGAGYAIEHADGRRETVPLQLEHSGTTARFVPAEAAAIVKDHDVDLVFPADELLVRTLDPLPAESRPYLDGIVRHQLERLAPWRASDVLHTYHVAAAGPDDSRLIVTIAATARSLHQHLLAALAAVGPRQLRLLYRDVPQTKGDLAIDVADNGASVARNQRLRRGVVLGLAGLTVVIVASAAVLALAWQKTETNLAEAEQAVGALRQKLSAAGARGPVSDQDLAAIVSRRRNTPSAVLAVDALSGALPDDTWLTELRIGEGRMRMSGVSRNVAGLVPLIEASPVFSEATFFAPTTRLPNAQGDRFHLETRLMPAAGGKP